MNILDTAKKVIEVEIEGLQSVISNLDYQFEKVIKAIIKSPGRVIICGMGKSGLIGKKIAASFASTGTSSFFMHPGEAFHGDLGMVRSEDIFIAISNSGETEEVLRLLPFLMENNNTLVAMSGNPESSLAKKSHYHLNTSVPKEACHLQLAPTSSTTAALVMGDALTVTLMNARNFKPEHFARLHPGGSLGRLLLNKVSDDLYTENMPIVEYDTTVVDVIHTLSNGMLGLVMIMENESVTAVITDGDLRRAIEVHQKEVFDLKAKDICSFEPVKIIPTASIQKAVELMDTVKVNCLVVEQDGCFMGVFQK